MFSRELLAGPMPARPGETPNQFLPETTVRGQERYSYAVYDVHCLSWQAGGIVTRCKQNIS
jgi:hypothetical protein